MGADMTIKDYLQNKKPTTCAAWVDQIRADGLGAYESQILTAADALGLVIVNHGANFQNAIKL
jgi:hypothetical protein